MSSKENNEGRVAPENKPAEASSTSKQAWVTPIVEDLGVGATALGAVPAGTPDGIGNIKS